MNIHTLERTTGNRRVTWYTLIGLVLVPIVVGGVLLWSLYDPTARLHTSTAAIVNNDQPVKVDGKTIPLGRQLAAGLVHQSDTGETKDDNYTWVITAASDASSGLDDGRYQAVVTIPKGFSKAAASAQTPSRARTATIDVQASDHSGIIESAVSTTITRTASTVFGREISKTYLDNVYLGFNTLHSQLAKADAGAKDLASGAAQAHEGANQLVSGTQSAQSGAHQLASGLDSLGAGAAQTNTGAQQVATGNAELASKVNQAETTLDQLTAKIGAAPDLTSQAQQLANGAAGVSQMTRQTADESAQTTQSLEQLSASCDASGASQAYCAQIAAVAQSSNAVTTGTQRAATTAATVSDGAAQIAQLAPQVQTATQQAGTALHQLSDATNQLANGSAQVAAGTAAVYSGTLSAHDGAVSLADGIDQLAAGASQLADGTGRLASGATSLHNGLNGAVKQVPTYSKANRTRLADAVTQPVSVNGASLTDLFSGSAMPFLASIALWIGALTLFLVLRPLTRTVMTSSASMSRIMARTGIPAVVIGAVQGVLVAAIGEAALHLNTASWLAFAGIAVLAGITFALVMQGVTALLGGSGRFLAVVAGAVAIGAGIFSSAPGLIRDVAAILPTASATGALTAPVTGDAGTATSGLVGLVVWSLIGLTLTAIAVSRHRSFTANAVISGRFLQET